MGENTTSGVVSVRLPHETIAALMRLAEKRNVTVNSMLVRMITRRVSEVRTEEGW